jgi:hypothetical protein
METTNETTTDRATPDTRLAQGEVKFPPSWELEEMSEKARAEAALHYQAHTTGFMQPESPLKARRPLRDRVGHEHWRAETEARRRDQLAELIDLLDRNPAIARILELIEATGV